MPKQEGRPAGTRAGALPAAGRRALLAAGLAMPFAAPGAARAQGAWPEKPVRLLIGYPAGGPTDFAARLLQPHLQALWGQPLVIENRAGANGIIASEAVARSAPDGHTLLLGNSPNTMNPAIQPRLPYDPAELAPVVLIYISPTVLFAAPDTPWRSVAEVVAAAKAQRGLSYAVSGVGSPGHFAGEAFRRAAGIDLTSVAYRGAPPALADVVAGRVPITFSTLAGAMPLLREGRLRALAVAGDSRVAALPDLPTLKELGFDIPDCGVWYGLLVPAGTPEAVQRRIAGDITGLLNQPEIRERFLAQAAIPVGEGPEDFTARYRAEIARWTAIAQAAGIKAE
ncbi:Bug family tripartite tricarboxylate transporter substrate binding protein [Roseicella aerolata]|uniref:Tripartite tricarboxylate transporter substrate binding protein n=1 Tax=Roseicella aerolata TaxID=2883479 RepID=A0A9X1IJB4_9PROT|nr:tripartite tricarboxylate transporter substrate-binding protein [Roseicella aerolata]MCB4824413.1 tripartite tricarboxylate transporter substrate binding protein [Roseicella aerolata]